MDQNERRTRIRSLLKEETQPLKPDIIGGEGGDESWLDALVELAKEDVLASFAESKETEEYEFWGSPSRQSVYHLTDDAEDAINNLSYVVDLTAYYDFQESEGNDSAELKQDFKSDLPIGVFRIEEGWRFNVYPFSLKEVDGRVLVTFFVDHL